MTGWKKTVAILILSTTVLSLTSSIFLFRPERAHATTVATLASHLSQVRQRLHQARADLSGARSAYQTALAAAQAAAPPASPSSSPSPAVTPVADPSTATTPQPAAAASPTPDALAALLLHVKQARQRVHRLHLRVRALRRQLRLARAIAGHRWMPVIRDAARRNGISATGLSAMMKLESGGRFNATSGAFHGLFQYCWSTWQAAWNPWRARSIYDGEAQIRATALAIHRGWGARMWPYTYPRAF